MRDVAVIGVGMTKWGELWEKSLRDDLHRGRPRWPSTTPASTRSTPCTSAACPAACSSARSTSASLLADYLGTGPIPATRVESACASGGAGPPPGLHGSGLRAERHRPRRRRREDDRRHGRRGDLRPGHGGRPGIRGLPRRHLPRPLRHDGAGPHAPLRDDPRAAGHGRGQEPRQRLAEPARPVPLQDHGRGRAQLRPGRRSAAHPRLLADHRRGGGGRPLPRPSWPGSSKKPVVRITGIGQATDTIALQLAPGPHLARVDPPRRGARPWPWPAGRSRTSHLSEVHDCFTIAEIMVIEALGLVEKGQGGKAVEEGLTRPGGRIPGQHQRRPQVQGPSRRRDRRRPGRRDRQAAPRRGGRPAGQGRPARPDPEHGRHRRQLRRPHLRGGIGGDDADTFTLLARDPPAIPAGGREVQELRLDRLPAARRSARTARAASSSRRSWPRPDSS